MIEMCAFSSTKRKQSSGCEEPHDNSQIPCHFLQIRKPWRTVAKRLRQGRGEIFSGINELIALKLVLLIVELAVSAISRKQILMRSPLHNLATFQHQNLIGATYR